MEKDDLQRRHATRQKKAILALLLEQKGLSGTFKSSIPPRNPAKAVPLSYSQERLWFLEQLKPGNAAYHMPRVLRVKGQLDSEALKNALQCVRRRHEGLRTTFVLENGRPVQKIGEDSALPDDQESLEGLPKEDQEELIRQKCSEEANHPFDLQKGPLLRMKVLRLSEEEHVVIFGMHHIVSDGWSMGILVRELGQFYPSCVSGEPAVLPPLPIQYADYAVWQREHLSGDRLAKQLEYWKNQLAGMSPLELATDRPRAATLRNAGGSLGTSLSQPLVDGLKELSRSHGYTLFTVLLAGYNALLYRYTGQTDLIVGTVVTGRYRVELENLIGFFINPIPLRSRFSRDSTFFELLQHVHETVRGAFAHQEIPFETVVEAVNPERRAERSPLFQMAMSFQAPDQELLSVPGLSISTLPLEDKTAKYDLVFAFQERAKGLGMELNYDSDLFERSTIERMLGHWETLLAEALKKPQKLISELGMLRDEERHQVLVGWNDTFAEYPHQCIHELFESQARQHPDAVALVSSEKQLTYRELDRRSNQLAHHLRKLQVGPEVMVGVCLDNSVEAIISLLGVLKAAGAYVPVDPAYPQNRIDFILRDTALPVLIVCSSTKEKIKGYSGTIIDLDEDLPVIARESAENPHSLVAPDNIGYVMFTSGSTGTPKGVLVPHRGIANICSEQMRAFEVGPGSRVLQFASLSFDASVFEIFMALGTGAALHLESRQNLLPGPEMIQLLNDRRITHVTLPPSSLRALPEAALPELRVIMLAGEACSAELIVRWLGSRKVFNLYGPTEGTIWSTMAPCEKTGNPPPIGHPISNTQIYLLDKNYEPVPIGVPGEICIAGVGVARGYLNQPALTAEKFVPDPFSPNEGTRLYCTGDMGKRLENGAIIYLGRMDQQVKIRGFRIELGEIEKALNGYENVGESIVVAQEDESAEKRLVAYVVPEKSGPPPDESMLREFLKSKLPRHMLPAAFVILETWPLLPNGKVNRRALPAPRLQEESRAVAPSDAVQELISGIWARVLKLKSVGITDNFFEIGGHSLLASQVMTRIKEVFQIDLPLRHIFEFPTVATLSECVKAARLHAPRQDVPLVKVARNGSLPLSHGQARIWFMEQLQPGGWGYHMPVVLRVEGGLEVGVLQRAMGELQKRQESMRTTFWVEEGKPVQRVNESGELALAEETLEGLSRDEQEERIKEGTQEELKRPFDLQAGPLARMKVWRLGEKEHVVMYTMHHIISDGWSMSILVRELRGLYEGMARGERVELPELPIQYADYAVWQREYLSGERMLEQLGYWKEKLKGLKLVELGTDKPRPAVRRNAGGSVGISWERDKVERLRELGRKAGATLFMTMLAGFKILLGRYSGQTDVAVGTAVANRGRSEVEGLIGFFVNTVVLRSDLSGDPTVEELVEKERGVTLEAYEHQEIPFEKVVEELQPQRDLSRSPLFEVMFVLHNAPAENLEQKGLKFSLVGLESKSSRFDLTLWLQENEAGVSGAMEYDSDLYEEKTIQRMVGHLERIYEAMGTGGGQRISELEMMGKEEKQEIVAGWNRTEAEHGAGSVVEKIEEQAGKRGGAVAVVSGSRSLTYEEMNGRANQLARRLRQLGVGPEVLVGICLERSAELVVALLAVLKAGGAYVPLDPDYPLERVLYVLEDSRAPVLITQKSLLKLTTGYAGQRICLEDWATSSPAATSEADSIPISPQNLAYVIYTSGSTGKPKGVQIQHGSLLNFLESMNREFKLGTSDVVIAVTSLSFDIAGLEIWLPLMTGARVVVLDREIAADGQRLAAEIHRNEGTLIQATPATWRLLVDAEFNTQREIKILCGGEALPLELARQVIQIGGGLWNMYGPTETTIWSTFEQLGMGTQQIGVGRPIANTQIYILDGELRPLPPRITGELYIGGDGLARGYFNLPELTAEKLIPDPYGNVAGARIYRTGDLARYREDGRIEYLGRNDSQVKIRGFRIELGEVEHALNSHPQIKESAVVVREDTSGEKRLIAYVVCKNPEDQPEENTVRQYLQSKLPAYMLPSLRILEKLPLTPNGKTDRQSLLKLPLPRSDLSNQFVAPRNHIEKTLAAIWAEVLRLDQVGIHDNFFELGGDSIQSIQIIARASRVGLELTPRLIFEFQTIAQLAPASGQLRAISAEQNRVAGAVPLTPAQHQFFELDAVEVSHFNQAVMLKEVRLVPPPDIIQRAICHLVEHHDALRLRFEKTESAWKQFNAAAEPGEVFLQFDFSLLDPAGQRQAVTAEASRLQSSLDLTKGPLIRVAWFDLGPAGVRLLVIIHQLAIDGASWRILLEDLQTACHTLQRGQAIQPLSKTTSFREWAKRLTEYAETALVQNQSSFWAELQKHEHVLLPRDRPIGQNTFAAEHVVRVVLPEADTLALLQKVPENFRVRINDVLLTALTKTLNGWTGSPSILVQLQGNGREILFENIDLGRTVGWFTYYFPVELRINPRTSLATALKSIKEQLRRVPHNGIGYGLLRYLSHGGTAREKFEAEIGFNYLGQLEDSSSGGWLEPAHEPMGSRVSARRNRSVLIEVTAWVSGGQLTVDWHYSKDIHLPSTVQTLADCFLGALRELIACCSSHEANGFTPSDFPLASLEQSELDSLIENLEHL